MLHQEWNFVGADFEHGRRPLDVVRTITKSRIEESGVMNSEHAVRWIERDHLSCELRRNAYSLFGGENIEVAGFENQILTGILMTNLPELFGRVKINLV